MPIFFLIQPKYTQLGDDLAWFSMFGVKIYSRLGKFRVFFGVIWEVKK